MESVESKYREALRRGQPEHGPYDEFSLRHPKMQLGQRAKIFSPFDALAGFSEAIDDKLVRYVEKRELTEEEQAQLNLVLTELHGRTQKRRTAGRDPVVATVTYYVPCPDEHHEAYGLRGSYETLTGVVGKVDPVLTRSLQIADTRIDFADIAAIRIEPSAEEEW